MTIQELEAWEAHWSEKARKARLNGNSWDAYEYEQAAENTRQEIAVRRYEEACEPQHEAIRRGGE